MPGQIRKRKLVPFKENEVELFKKYYADIHPNTLTNHIALGWYNQDKQELIKTEVANAPVTVEAVNAIFSKLATELGQPKIKQAFSKFKQRQKKHHIIVVPERAHTILTDLKEKLFDKKDNLDDVLIYLLEGSAESSSKVVDINGRLEVQEPLAEEGLSPYTYLKTLAPNLHYHQQKKLKLIMEELIADAFEEGMQYQKTVSQRKNPYDHKHRGKKEQKVAELKEANEFIRILNDSKTNESMASFKEELVYRHRKLK